MRARMAAAVWAGWAALTGIVTAAGAAFLALGLFAATQVAEQPVLFDAYLWRVVRFTLLQAGLSTILSILPAIVLARALTRRQRFPGRTALLRLLALPLALPALVVVLGIVQVWGQSGWANAVLKAAGFETGFNIYGLTGILIAHVFFNASLATRLLLSHLDRIPAENWRLASQLGMQPWSIFRLIEWPVLRAGLPGAASLVFLLCIASFTVVLTLGGGPKATTIEVAIYQALRFDFDPARAVLLALLQLSLCAGLIVLGGRFSGSMIATKSVYGWNIRPDVSSLWGRLADFAIIGVSALLLLLPLTAVVAGALSAPFAKLLGEPVFWRAVMTSVIIASVAAISCLVLTWCMLAGLRTLRSGQSRRVATVFTNLSMASASLILVLPPVVLGTGWFILLRPVTDVFAVAPGLVIMINTLMALPFAMRILQPAVTSASDSHERLCASLGMSGWHRFRLIDWPVLRAPLGLAFAFAMALSIGDLGAIALFGSEDFTTLPLLMFQRMGSYRMDEAAGLALLLLVFCLGLIYGAEGLARPRQVPGEAVQ